ncbi:hypothetical protein [Candidatus Amarolinea dominans]|uniref:hypothetical protein n=1 Tax=Candidatus Amarolinea dominans TaxID=3140696 RepID=UPI003137016E|nr:hypothetical protein [Anaerolineae bacterium]
MACLTWRYWNSIISHTSRRVWGWTFLGWSDNQPLVAALGLLLAAASLGFLGHNWPLARIFMGDVGSAFLGYTFAVLPVVAAQHNPRLAVAGVLLVWPFLFRLRHRENIFAAHRSHLYQRLVIAGYSHRTVTLLYSGLAAAGALLALLWTLDGAGSGLAVVLSLPPPAHLLSFSPSLLSAGPRRLVFGGSWMYDVSQWVDSQ